MEKRYQVFVSSTYDDLREERQEVILAVVSRSIVKLIKSNPAVAWTKANELAEETAAPELLKLRKKIEELQTRLEESREQGPQGTEMLALSAR